MEEIKLNSKSFEENPDLEIMLRKFSGAFERIDQYSLDFNENSEELVSALNKMILDIRGIQSCVKHQRGHFDRIFKVEGK